MAGSGRHDDWDLTTPNGCRWCGVVQREHARRWTPPTGWHQWEPPTDEQRKHRMLARRRGGAEPQEAEAWLLCG
ncbi:hypothetical protein GCM10011609_33720 [Lentzea pudingi]|uniref:Uncharacterized protein n=1 Tax=Lentzea pudingi TaxID=1789439 RepID=A0ABQ2HZ14_9PSEU|nr:hypothetical protein GCM10011609_33720 [Lentzea pudingi]